MAEGFLQRLMNLFDSTYGKAPEGLNADVYYSKTIRKYLLQLQEDYKKAHTVTLIEEQIDKVTIDAQNNLNKLIQQTDSTQNILAKTDQLSDLGDIIAMKSTELKNKFFWRRYRFQLMFLS